MSSIPIHTDAEAHFHTSSIYKVPDGHTAWVIRNDYPGPRVAAQGGGVITAPGQLPPGMDPTPWLHVDFKTNPIEYMQLVKEYFLEGMIESDFVPQNNQARQWFHASWMHCGVNGREPIRGLFKQGITPPYNLASGQKDYLANWGNGFYNSKAASVYGQIWANPNNPQAERSVRFPPGSIVVKIVFTTATNEQVPSMKGSPEWYAAISSKPNFPQPRNSYASTVRLIQMDIAVTEDKSKAPLGWVFGTFWYNGIDIDDDRPNEPVREKWNRLMPVGLQWGNDPKVTQAVYEAGGPDAELRESWVNPEANNLLWTLGGKRPFLGWNGRLNGPADAFISACMSCHSVAQVKVPTSPALPVEPPHKPPHPVEGPAGTWRPNDDRITMEWFRNIGYREPFTAGAVSLDYNLEATAGLKHYFNWANKQKEASGETLAEREIQLAGRPVPGAPRTGPEINFI